MCIKSFPLVKDTRILSVYAINIKVSQYIRKIAKIVRTDRQIHNIYGTLDVTNG